MQFSVIIYQTTISNLQKFQKNQKSSNRQKSTSQVSDIILDAL